MDNDLMEDKLHELIDQFNERKVNHKDFYFALLDNMVGMREFVRCCLGL